MRCTSCGVENAPDSRFCGGCGALQTVQPRLAPTAKIPDDAPFAPPTRPVAPISPLGGVSYSPPSMPPQPAPAPIQQAGLTTRPGGHSAPPRTSSENAQVRPSGGHALGERRSSAGFDSITPTAQQQRVPGPGTVQRPGTNRPQTEPPRRQPQASMSFSAPVGHRSLGLIAVVLIVDLGLAGAGALLLAKGLSKPNTENAEKAEKTEKKSEAPRAGETAVVSAEPTPSPAVAQTLAPTPTPTPTTGITAAPITEAPPAEQTAAKTGAAARKTHGTSQDKLPSTSTSTTTSAGPVTSPGSISGSPTTPVPTPGPSTESQIGALVNRSQGSFDRCRGDAALAGSIGIAFQVNPDGSITNAAAVENTTGNAEVGQCLARVIAGWRVTQFQGTPMSFMRPFSYP